jgi:hypothetical protein
MALAGRLPSKKPYLLLFLRLLLPNRREKPVCLVSVGPQTQPVTPLTGTQIAR